MQGNILASAQVVTDAANALEEPDGDIIDKVMAAMEAADDSESTFGSGLRFWDRQKEKAGAAKQKLADAGYELRH